jgi:hypothetical protein
MSDVRADELGDEDRLPWLEAVDDEEDGDGPSAAKLIAAVMIGLVAIGLIVGGLFWLGNRSEGSEEQLIAAPEGDYKVPPDSPGGMPVEGEGDTAYAASAGADPQSNLNIEAVPETPVTQSQSQPQPQQPAQSQPPSAQPAAPAAAPGGTIQLGAFSSQAAANNAWRALSGRFSYLSPLSHSVTPIESGGRTLYRLRASGPDAASLCGRLRVAGETCAVIG